MVGWPQASLILSGAQPYFSAPLPALKPALLAPDVRRRTTDHIRLAIEVASEAAHELGESAKELATIFASSESDGQITHDICLEVAKEEPQVSPTRFHNSVTNAAAGYWCMAIGSQQASTSVAAYDATFAAGLIEAAAQINADAPRVLLVAHDVPLPDPLIRVRPMTAPFGAAFVLARENSPRAKAKLKLGVEVRSDESTLADPGLEKLRRGNPAARALPLLVALANCRSSETVLPYLDNLSLRVRIDPCQ
jgi:hypothetical protein